jgi:hypothetical protein
MSVVMGEHGIPAADIFENMRRDVDGCLFEGRFRISTMRLLRVLERYNEIKKLIQKKLDLRDKEYEAYESNDEEQIALYIDEIDELEREINRCTDFYERWSGIDTLFSKLVDEYDFEIATEKLTAYYTEKIYKGVYNER